MWPDDTDVETLSRTVGTDRVVDELLIRCTHTRQMDFWLPGIAATGRSIALPTVAIVSFEGDLIVSEHIYWDQASLLAQVGCFSIRRPLRCSPTASVRAHGPRVSRTR